MRKFSFSAIVLLPLFFAVPAPSSANPPCDPRKLTAMQQFSDNAAKVYDKTVASPDPLSIESCIGSLSSFGVLKFPDLTGLGQDILKRLCQEIKSRVSSAASGMQYNFQSGQFGSMGLGQGVGGSSSTSLGSVPITITPAPAASGQSGQNTPSSQIMSVIK